MPPFAGQGLCSGLRDAPNLAWKLDLVLDERAARALLETYQSERLPSARAALAFSPQLGKVICGPDPAAAPGPAAPRAPGARGPGRPPRSAPLTSPPLPTSPPTAGPPCGPPSDS